MGKKKPMVGHWWWNWLKIPIFTKIGNVSTNIGGGLGAGSRFPSIGADRRDYEPASALLERIKAEREAGQKTPASKKPTSKRGAGDKQLSLVGVE